MFWDRRKPFCKINPTCYALSLQKEIIKRHLKNFFSKEKFAKEILPTTLPNVIADYNCGLIKTGKGIDPVLQENKAVNIQLACDKINGMVIHPGEVFSFWVTVGKTTKARGYREGRVIINGRLIAGLGGGLCNLGNTIHYMVLHSPLTVVEFHHHSDALAPDHGKRIPFSSGTSISYNYIDYRFKNETDQDVQLKLWCADKRLYGELRSEREFPWRYELVEEEHHFQQECEKFFRVSKIYRNVIERATNKILRKELILNNHSEVMYDYDLIPPEMIQYEGVPAL